MPPMSGNQRPPDYRKEIMEGGQKPLINFTEEDKALLDKCNRDAFFQRSLPLLVLSSGSVLVASQRGLITKGNFYDNIQNKKKIIFVNNSGRYLQMKFIFEYENFICFEIKEILPFHFSYDRKYLFRHPIL